MLNMVPDQTGCLIHDSQMSTWFDNKFYNVRIWSLKGTMTKHKWINKRPYHSLTRRECQTTDIDITPHTETNIFRQSVWWTVRKILLQTDLIFSQTVKQTYISQTDTDLTDTQTYLDRQILSQTNRQTYLIGQICLMDSQINLITDRQTNISHRQTDMQTDRENSYQMEGLWMKQMEGRGVSGYGCCTEFRFVIIF